MTKVGAYDDRHEEQPLSHRRPFRVSVSLLWRLSEETSAPK